MMILLALAAEQQLPSAPPVPVVSATMIRAMPVSAGPISVTTLDVEVRAAGELLWAGQMRVSDRGGASFNRQQSNADDGMCPAAAGYYGGDRSSFTISLSNTRRGDGGTGLEVRASWDRPGDGGSCQLRPSTRTVGVSGTFSIDSGGEQTRETAASPFAYVAADFPCPAAGAGPVA